MEETIIFKNDIITDYEMRVDSMTKEIDFYKKMKSQVRIINKLFLVFGKNKSYEKRY